MEFTNEARLDEHIQNEHKPKTDILVNRSGSKRVVLRENKPTNLNPKSKINNSKIKKPNSNAKSNHKSDSK